MHGGSGFRGLPIYVRKTHILKRKSMRDMIVNSSFFSDVKVQIDIVLSDIAAPFL
jgi:hypothetical protein